MLPVEAFKLAVLQNYVNFSGRANRSEYWYFVLANVIVVCLTMVLCAILPDAIGGILYLLVNLGLMLPGIAAGIRRLHDINKSGWFMLVALIPLVGGFILLYFMVQPSDDGTNDYGEPSNNLY